VDADALTIQIAGANRARRAAHARALVQAGYRVVQSGDLRRALAQLRRERPIISVACSELPPQGGAALRDRAREHPLTAQIPFILVRADSSPPALPAKGGTLHDRVLVEPLSAAGLVRHVHEVLHALVHGAPPATAQPDLLRLEVHDLKAPLGNIVSLSELMLTEPLDPKQREEFLASIAANAQSMLKLVMNLLNVAALESGRLSIRPEPAGLHELMQAALQQIAWLVRRKGAKVENRIPPDVPTLECDRELLVRVLVNLLDNAVQHSKAGESIEVSAETEADGVRIDVKDRGPGVPEAFRTRVFEEFFRLGAGGPRSTGLGLTYCRLVTEAHGGRIWVAPRQGGGSCFSVFLPLRVPQGTA